MFSFLYGFVRVFSFLRAIALAVQGRPYALGMRILTPQLRRAAQREQKKQYPSTPSLPPERTSRAKPARRYTPPR
jgi:hypothetical protein